MVILTDNQIKALQNKLADADGKFNVEVVFDNGLMVQAEGFIEIHGYVEDEFHVGGKGYIDRSDYAKLT